MNLLIVSVIVLFMLTFLTLAARGGSSVESTVNPGPTSSAGVPDSAQVPLQDHLVTTSHSTMIHGDKRPQRSLEMDRWGQTTPEV